MAIKTFTAGSVLTASDTNTYLANSGLVYVTQVTVGSGVSTVDISNCFSSTYDNYKVSFQGISSSTSQSLCLFLLSGSTPTSANWNGTEFFVSVGGTVISGQLSAPTNAYAYCGAGSALSGIASVLEMQSPYLAQYSRFQYAISASDYHRWGFALHGANTSYNGFRITTTGGTMTGGTITVYGYRKA